MAINIGKRKPAAEASPLVTETAEELAERFRDRWLRAQQELNDARDADHQRRLLRTRVETALAADPADELVLCELYSDPTLSSFPELAEPVRARLIATTPLTLLGPSGMLALVLLERLEPPTYPLPARYARGMEYIDLVTVRTDLRAAELQALIRNMRAVRATQQAGLVVQQADDARLEPVALRVKAELVTRGMWQRIELGDWETLDWLDGPGFAKRTAHLRGGLWPETIVTRLLELAGQPRAGAST